MKNKKYKCKYCGDIIINHQHQIWCIKNPNRENILKKCKLKTFKMSDESKKKISLGRINYLKNNKNKHNWSVYRNKESYPEKLFREQLEKIENIIFYQYYIPNEFDKNYELDFALINEKIGFEINGHQHYDEFGKLTEYYKKRHDYIESFGWKIIEINYLNCFDNNNIKNIINNSINNIKFNDKKINDVINYKKIKIKNNKLNKEQYLKIKRNKYEEEQKKYINLVLNSNINFSKFGWVKNVSTIINKKPGKVNIWMKRFMNDFYNNECFKKRLRSPI